jgi:hypothetical protein
MGSKSCIWVRDRLPLVAGGEWLGPDRRPVERHLIGCPACRQRLDSLRDALAVLHVAAAESPADPEAPSLWPALARQIRESRRPQSSWEMGWLRSWAWPSLGLAAGLFVAVGILSFGPDPRLGQSASNRSAAPKAQGTGSNIATELITPTESKAEIVADSDEAVPDEEEPSTEEGAEGPAPAETGGTR